MNHTIPNWDTYFMNMLDIIATRSKDKHTKVGCVIVGPSNEIRSTGYNSLPRGLDDNIPERFERPCKYQYIEHADRNAIYNAARVGIPLEGCKMYLPFFPCIECTRAVIQVGITEVIVNQDIIDERNKLNNSIYNQEIEIAETMLNEAKIKITRYRKNS